MIRFLIMDVDGTLTNGKIYIGKNGEVFKAFDVKDGCGIKELLPIYSIIPVVITARKSIILQNRCDELGISFLFQGVSEKLDKLTEIIDQYNSQSATHYSLENCAYIGDDLLDLQCMKLIKESGGLVGCPSDAVVNVKAVADYISCFNGGEGAVRDFIEWIVNR